MTDCDFVLDVLKDEQWHSTTEILSYSIHERGVGLTVHSRIADLRAKRGLTIEHRQVTGRRAQAHQYRLVGAVRESESSPGMTAKHPGPRSPEPSLPTVQPLLPEGLPPEPGPAFPEAGPGQLSVFAA